MKRHHRTATGRAHGFLAACIAVAVGGCTSTGTPGTSPPADSAPPSVEPGSGDSPAPSDPFVIEDAGLETVMPAGTYSTRLFMPALTFVLGDGWFRRDANGERTLNLRRGPNGEDDLTFISGMDFLQCGTAPVVEAPDARTIVDAIAASETLSAGEITDVPIGDRTGLTVRLPGGGEPVSEDDFGRLNEFGCIVSIGEEPFPAESLWMTMTPDAKMHLAFVDVDGVTVAIRARSDLDPDAMTQLMLEVLASVAWG